MDYLRNGEDQLVNEHRFISTIKEYYEGCNTRNETLMKSTFTDDVIHYFVDHPAVSSADGLANYWCKVGPTTHATWSVDHAMVQEPEAVIEWSMLWKPLTKDSFEVLRGTEWFVFRDDKIAEIRSYHCNFYLNDPQNRSLHEFDYVGRGYLPEA